jgi:hypothetical protein
MFALTLGGYDCLNVGGAMIAMSRIVDAALSRTCKNNLKQQKPVLMLFLSCLRSDFFSLLTRAEKALCETSTFPQSA